jgi:predicted permease
MSSLPRKIEHPPRIPLAIIAALLPEAERGEVVRDLTNEFVKRSDEHGAAHAKRWLREQAIRSSFALLRWTWWRSITGFEPRSSAFRPRRPIMHLLLTDARYALRRLSTRPAYTIVSVITLAVGIGGTAAIFALARPIIVDALPYANAGEVGTFWRPESWTDQEFLALRAGAPGFQAVAAYRQLGVPLRDGDAPARLAFEVQGSAELFDVLGARPLLGRAFARGDDVSGGQSVAVISYDLWQELGGTDAIVGRRITLENVPVTIVGVMPRGFWFPTPDVRVWQSAPLDQRNSFGSYTLVGRTPHGTDLHGMGSQLRQLTALLTAQIHYPPQLDVAKDAAITPLRDELTAPVRPAILAMFAAIGLIFLIACVNVAALMLGQVEGRAAELAVRSALGATRWRIAQQLFIESVLLGLLAGTAGAGVAVVGFRFLAHVLPRAWSDSATFDWTMFVAVFVIALLGAVLLMSATFASLRRGNLRDTLNGVRAGYTRGGGRGGRIERALIVTEVALAMLVATGAALLVRSVRNRYALDLGFDPRGVAVLNVSMDGVKPVEFRRTVDELTAAVAAVPGVRSAAAGLWLPLTPYGQFPITIEGRDKRNQGGTYGRVITKDYFATMGITLRAGRLFDDSDRPDSTEIAVVINEALAKRFFPGENPLGRVVGGAFGKRERIVGVVANVAEGKLTGKPVSARYYFANQASWLFGAANLVVRATRPRDVATVITGARRAVQRVSPRYVAQTSTMDQTVAQAVGPARQILPLIGLLAALAIVLGALGIYGVISHFALRRKREWAIRVALGLRGSGVVVHVVNQGIALAALGIAAGAVGAAGLTRLLSSFLFGVRAIDPMSFGGAALVVLLLGAAAAIVPAWRAGTVDPATVLREQ